jgi:hypothetical protein
MLEGCFTQFTALCTDMQELKGFWTENTDALEGLKKIDAEAYSRVKAAFTTRRNEVEKANV